MDFLNEAHKIEANQYYYKMTELHTTVLSIITCHLDFRMNEMDIPSYIETLMESVSTIPSFKIQYRGITASPDCVMIQGFPQDSTLQKLRENIRRNFKKAGLMSTLDARFKTQTAHVTCLRFQEAILNHSDEFLRFLKGYRDLDFGISEISELDFVMNDWYMSDGHVEVLHRYSLF